MFRAAGRRRVLGVLVGAVVALPTGIFTSTAYAVAAPTITSPADASSYCRPYGGTMPVSGGGVPGATVNLLVDGSPATTAVVQGDGTWAASVFITGMHDLTATQDDGGGASVASNSVHVDVDQVPYVYEEVSRTGISPANGDGAFDTVHFLAGAQGASGDLTQTIKTQGGVPVRTFTVKPVTDGGSASWTWDGRDDLGELVPDGSYRSWVTWSQEGTDCTVEHSEPIRVDNTAPAGARLSVAYRTFYPAENDALTEFRDVQTFGAGGLDSKVSTSKVELFKGDSTTPFLTLDGSYGSPNKVAKASWGGQAHGSLMPEGRYEARFVLLDDLRNKSYTPRIEFFLSHKHLVAKTKYVSKAGADFADKQQANSCGMTVSKTKSKYAHGVRLDYCGKTQDDISLLVYRIHAPAAAAYVATISPAAYGYSPSGDNRIALWTWNFVTPDNFRLNFAGAGEAFHTFKNAYGSKPFVNSRGVSELIAAFAGPGRYDYDIRDLGFIYRYGVLVS